LGFKDFLLTVFPHRWLDLKAPGVIRLFGGIGAIFDELDNLVKQVQSESRVATAVHTIPDREAEYGILIKPALSIEVRRANLLARERDKGGPITKDELINVLKAYNVEFNVQNVFNKQGMYLSTKSDVPNNVLGQMMTFVESVTRAHVGKLWMLLHDPYCVIYAYLENKSIVFGVPTGSYVAGRWPWWNSPGQLKKGIAGVDAVSIAGNGFFDATAYLYSGLIRDKSNEGVVLKVGPEVHHGILTGIGLLPSISVLCGKTPNDSSIGVKKQVVVQAKFSIVSGFGIFTTANIKCGKTPNDSSMGTKKQATFQVGIKATTGLVSFPHAGVSVGESDSLIVKSATELKAGSASYIYCGPYHSDEEVA
jgi:hypothetical protein